MTNVDRSPQNPNLLLWHGRLWLIDHGAALYLQHAWEDPPADAHRAFPAIRTHVLLPCAGSIAEADARMAPRLTRAVVEDVAALVPDEWYAPRERDAVRRVPLPPARGAARLRRRGGGGAPCRRLSARRPFQYAIVRVVPRVERGECVNAGVVLFCRPRRFLAARIALDEARVLRARARRRPRGDPPPPRRVRADRGGRTRRPARSPRCPASERFHWLVAPSSTVIQCSPGPHRAQRRPRGGARPAHRPARGPSRARR